MPSSSSGVYVSRVKNGLLLDGQRPPRRVRPPAPAGLPARPLKAADGTSGLLASVEAFEEKGSDVNVGSHLLRDVLTDRIDAAIVVSNDSDLALRCSSPAGPPGAVSSAVPNPVLRFGGGRVFS